MDKLYQFGAVAHVGDAVLTRRNDRSLATLADDFVRNRELWTVVDVAASSLIGCRTRDKGVLSSEHVLERVQLGYATTEPGNQSDASARSITLVTPATTAWGLYVGMTRGRQENLALEATGNHGRADARDLLEQVIANVRDDVLLVTLPEMLGRITTSRARRLLKMISRAASAGTCSPGQEAVRAATMRRTSANPYSCRSPPR